MWTRSILVAFLVAAFAFTGGNGVAAPPAMTSYRADNVPELMNRIGATGDLAQQLNEVASLYFSHVLETGTEPVAMHELLNYAGLSSAGTWLKERDADMALASDEPWSGGKGMTCSDENDCWVWLTIREDRKIAEALDQAIDENGRGLLAGIIRHDRDEGTLYYRIGPASKLAVTTIRSGFGARELQNQRDDLGFKGFDSGLYCMIFFNIWAKKLANESGDRFRQAEAQYKDLAVGLSDFVTQKGLFMGVPVPEIQKRGLRLSQRLGNDIRSRGGDAVFDLCYWLTRVRHLPDSKLATVYAAILGR